MQDALWMLTWIIAAAGALLSVTASWTRAKSRLSSLAAGRLHMASYVLLGLSMSLFVLRGLLA